MRPQDLVHECLTSLSANRLRSALAVLGIVIGVASVTIMVSVGEGSQQSVRKSIESLGSNLLMVVPTDGGSTLLETKQNALSVDDAETLLGLPSVLAAAAVSGQAFAQAGFGNKRVLTRILGVGQGYFTVRDWKTQSGDLFNEDEVRQGARVVVIGATLATELFGQDDPIGTYIKVKEVPLQVIGVLRQKGRSVDGVDQDNTLIVPLLLAQQRLLSDASDKKIAMLVAKSRGSDSFQAARKEVDAALRQARRLEPDQPSPYTVRNPSDLAKSALRTRKIMTLLLASIASISLIVGGIGIMNIMCVCVTERTREIGIRKSIGARNRDILLQFLLEAVLMALIGCAVGVGVGVFGTWVASSYFNIATALSLWSIAISTATAVTVGVFFGFYPARKAAKLLPVEALRYQ